MGESAIQLQPGDELMEYKPVPTLKRFHECGAQMRCIVGPVGSSKTTGATWETCYYLPFFLFERYGMKKTRGVVVRNTYSELRDTTLATVLEWFGWGEWKAGAMTLTLRYPNNGPEVEILFRSCDRPDDVKKFKSLEITWYWIDESIEVKDEIKKMLKNRIGRYPRKSPVRFGIETTNPPDVEHPTYRNFDWVEPPPGPIPLGKPLKNHIGFWQPPRENEANLRPGYYNDLIEDYRDDPDWIERYVDGKPGVMVRGMLVYPNFKRKIHVAEQPLVWPGEETELIRGWDNSGNCPAAVVIMQPTPGRIHIMREFVTDKLGIVDFTSNVIAECNTAFPGATWIEWADPAGANKFSKKEGGFTSNAQLMEDACGVSVQSSEQNLRARIESVNNQLGKIDGVLIDPSCIRLINGFLGGYCYTEIGNTGTYRNEPEKNRFSHPHDALQYAMVKTVSYSGAQHMTQADAARMYQQYAPPPGA